MAPLYGEESPQHLRTKSASALLTAKLSPGKADRLPRDDRQQRSFGETSINARSVPLLPPDHPHAALLAGSENVDPTDERQRKPGLTRRSKSAVSLRSLIGGDTEKEKTPKPGKSPRKKSRKDPKVIKTKSSTGLSTVFAKLNRSKNLAESGDDEQNPAQGSLAQDLGSVATRHASKVRPDVHKAEPYRLNHTEYSPPKQRHFPAGIPTLGKPQNSKANRPKSMIMTATRDLGDLIARQGSAERSQLSSRGSDSSYASRTGTPSFFRTHSVGTRHVEPDARKASSSSSEQTSPSKLLNVAKRGSRVMAAVAAIDGRDRTAVHDVPRNTKFEQKDVDQAFEAVLAARNVPEEQRRKMRTLTLHVKADFVKQDQATQPRSPSKPATCSAVDIKRSDSSRTRESSEEKRAEMGKRSRPRSKTFTFSKGETSPTKRQKSVTRPISIHGAETLQKGLHNLLSPSSASVAKHAQAITTSPEEFVDYLRTVQNPIETEVGRVHKLRLLLRNETVSWVDDFIRLGGMQEIVDLLHRIMGIQWREDHEDQLLHETLLCLKGLCTTTIALQNLDHVADSLLPPLVNLVFDQERKGPSEFNTRGIVFSIMFAFLNGMIDAPAEQLESRARKILKYLEGPSMAEDAQPVSFVLDMRVRRPYRVWCREVTNVLKEVFWIFLHHSNVVPLPEGESEPRTCARTEETVPYVHRHFPRTRPPTPAAPYIGGVEWDATNYMAAHLDLVNGLIASLPTAQARNALRSDIKASGFENIMGASLRTCKEKFYACVHDALRVWVAAAVEDGWDTLFVRVGPTVEERAEAAVKTLHSPVRKPMSPEKEADRRPPKLDHVVPRLDLGLSGDSF